MKRIIQLAIVALVLAPLTVGAQTTTMQITYTWAAPTTGSPVHHYEVEKSTDNGTTWTAAATVTANSTTLGVPVLVPIQIRVRGVDAAGRSGPWSQPSDSYTPDPGPPGACGKPART